MKEVFKCARLGANTVVPSRSQQLYSSMPSFTRSRPTLQKKTIQWQLRRRDFSIFCDIKPMNTPLQIMLIYFILIFLKASIHVVLNVKVVLSNTFEVTFYNRQDQVSASLQRELDDFNRTASLMLILFDEKLQYHPQYDGFNNTSKQSNRNFIVEVNPCTADT